MTLEEENNFLKSENLRLTEEVQSAKKEVIDIATKLYPIFKLLEIDKMYAPGEKPSTGMVVIKTCKRLVQHWAEISDILNREKQFFTQVMSLFFVKYAKDVQETRKHNIANFKSPKELKALGTSSTTQNAIGK